MCFTLDVPFSKNYAVTLENINEQAKKIIICTPELNSKNIWEYNLTPKHMASVFNKLAWI